MRLEARVTLWLLGLIGAGAAVTGFGITHFQRQSLERQFGDTGRVLALAVKNSLEVSMLNNAPEDVRKTVRNVQRGGLIKSVAVYRRSGSPWVASAGLTQPSAGERRALYGSMAGEEPRSASSGSSLTMFVPVTKHPECASCHPGTQRVLGAVGVVLDELPLQRELTNSTRHSLYMAAAPLALGLLASLWAVRRGVLRPLSMVGAAAKRVAAGDLDVRLPAFPSGELGSLSKTFNEMASRLQLQTADMRRTLEQLHSDLEGMEEVQSLLASGAGLGEMLARGADRMAPAPHTRAVRAGSGPFAFGSRSGDGRERRAARAAEREGAEPRGAAEEDPRGPGGGAAAARARVARRDEPDPRGDHDEHRRGRPAAPVA
ncbi:MAG: HAMP domain-containing protein [Acidobacteria bacterium]|nr:HAMP domain-containing protein [Acidobacteriota bacterium]